MLQMDHLVGAFALGPEPAVQPWQRRSGCRIVIAQPLEQLGGERIGQRRPFEAFQARRRGRRSGVGFLQQQVRERVRAFPQLAAMDDSGREPAQILDQYDPQRDCNRPQFADRERLHALIGPREP